MRYKSKIFKKFKKFRYEIEKQTEKLLKIFWSDRRGEYLSKKFWTYLKKNDIVSQWTPPGHLNSMGYPRGGIESYWIWFGPWWASQIFLTFFGDMLCCLWFISWIGFPLNLFLPHHMSYGMVRNQLLGTSRFGDVQSMSRNSRRTS